MSENTRIVVISPRDSEYEQLQAVERAGVSIGGPIGLALIGVASELRDGVLDRAVVSDAA